MDNTIKDQISILRKLQELTLTRDEHNQAVGVGQTDSIDDSIIELKGRLEPQIRNIYDRLYKKNHVVIAAMSNGCCAACGMQVPIAQGQQVRLARHVVTCSSCGRVLFADDADAAHNVKVSLLSDRDESIVGIARFSAPELMIHDLKGKTPQDAIAELSVAMKEHGNIANAESLVAAAMEREGVLSTAVGNEIAFPHVRGVEGGGLTLAMGISRNGIDWDGENRVKIVFLSAIPVAVSAFYLRLMAGITQAFDRKANVSAIMAATNQQELWNALVKITKNTVK